jgi:hypothetical protein
MRAHTRKIITSACAVAALVLSSAALAVTGGTRDSADTYVGGVVQAQVQNGTAGFERCTGFLIGPTHFVTASHCFDSNGGAIQVTFDNDLCPAVSKSCPTVSNFVPATIAGSVGDVTVLTLQVAQPAWATLPAFVGAAESVTSVDIIGYGVEGFDPKKAPTGFGTRSIATTPVKSAGNMSDIYLKLLASPGACFGDSGGPNVVSGTHTVVAITSGGLKYCQGISYAQRIDTPTTLPFLTQFANS